MTQIEQKRKELEYQTNSLENLKDYLYYHSKGELIGFNLGVEMATKEFIEWLKDNSNKMNNTDCRMFEFIEKKYKQSLEEKK